MNKKNSQIKVKNKIKKEFQSQKSATNNRNSKVQKTNKIKSQLIRSRNNSRTTQQNKDSLIKIADDNDDFLTKFD